MCDAINPPPAKVLLVDDDANLLSGLRRKLRKAYDLVTAEGPEAALDAFRNQGPFAVVVADMQMPKMNGVELLKRVAAQHPDTIRVMLTGNADQPTAAAAVNEGSVFRFLNKPCDTDSLKAVIDAAIQQHRLVTAEKQLLSQTLRGSIKLLVDLIAVVDPEAHALAMKLRERVGKLAGPLAFERPWEAEIAAMIAPLGFAVLPEEVRAKLDRPSRMSDKEKAALADAKERIAALVRNIPRLEGVATILRYQAARFDGNGAPAAEPRGSNLPMASRVLHALFDLAELEATGLSVPAAVDVLRKTPGKFDPAVLDAIERHVSPPTQRVPTDVPIRDVINGQVLVDDVLTADGRLLLRKDATITDATRAALKNYHSLGQLDGTVRVYVNQPLAEAA